DEVRVEMHRGTDPLSEPVRKLAQRWQTLLQLFTGGDSGITKSLSTMYKEEGPAKSSRGMLDQELCDYIGRSLAAISSK
ncbi:TipAS antibiotic-recognition domain-containing protein, partial [Vibrio parahaemolyticus]